MATKQITTSVVLTPEQHLLLKQIASFRVLKGKADRASVSDVIRQLIERNENKLRAELEALQK